MEKSYPQGWKNIRPLRLLLPIAILGFTLFFAYGVGFLKTQPGLNHDYSYVIINISACSNDSPCYSNPDGIRIGDKILKVGTKDTSQLNEFPHAETFTDYQPGDLVPLTIQRGYETYEVTWIIPEDNILDRLSISLTSLLITLPYWLVGSATYLFMYPHDDKWFQFVLFCYLITMWLAVGINPASQEGFFTLELTRLLSWLIVPTIIHLHLVAPSQILKKKIPLGLATVYVICYSMAIYSFFNTGFGDTSYLSGLMIAILFSLVVLIYRSFFRSTEPERQASRLMLLGILLAPVFALLVWGVPSIFGLFPGQDVVNFVILALPIMPITYGYALYKPMLGEQENRINRIVVGYIGFLVFLTILLISFIGANEQLENQREFLTLAGVIVLALFFSLTPFRNWIARQVNRVIYGTTYRRDEILSRFANRVSTTTDRESLVSLIQFELLPVLQIEESALFTHNETKIEIIYEQGLKIDGCTLSFTVLHDMQKAISVYLLPPVDGGQAVIPGCSWLRLIIPLEVHNKLIGYWLFGKRKPDNYYNKDDIKLLSTFAGQIAITLHNRSLYQAVQNELIEKERAEKRLAKLTERLSFVNAIDLAILQANTPEQIAQFTLNNLSDLFQCDQALISLLDSENQGLEILASLNGSTSSSVEQVTEAFPLGGVGKLFSNGETWFVEEVGAQRIGANVSQFLQRNGIRSFVIIPLIANHNMIGYLYYASKEKKGITPEYIPVLEDVAKSIAVAIYNARLRETVAQHSRHLVNLSAQLIEAQENERKNISYELHDEMGQILTAITFNLADIERSAGPNITADLKVKIDDTRELTNQLLARVRDLSLKLRPAMLHDLGLMPTLRRYIKNYSERFHLEVVFETQLSAERYPENMEITLYRVVQEALTNISKHASASLVLLNLEQQNDRLCLSIKDNGIGFDTNEITKPSFELQRTGFGLIAMRERVGSLSGSFDIKSEIGKGTELLITIPFPDNL